MNAATEDILRPLAIRVLGQLGTLAEYWDDAELAQHSRDVAAALQSYV
ncbi:MAG: hypothetical protein U1U88_000126 [Lawsonella clevelandensis]